jgi:hypothetical protein
VDVRVRVASHSFSAARIHASASTAAQSGEMPSYIPPSCASKGVSVRPTFTLHARFRYARSTFVNLYLNYRSNLRVLSLLRSGRCARALTLQRHAHFVPGSGFAGLRLFVPRGNDVTLPLPNVCRVVTLGPLVAGKVTLPA